MVEPFEIVYYNIKHHDTCNLFSTEEVEQRQFVRAVKDQIAYHSHRPLQQIYESSVLEYLTSPESTVTSLNDYKEVKHVFKYARKKTNPASLPNSLAELEVLDTQKVVTRGIVEEKFLIYDNHKRNRILLFCSESCIEILSMSKIWHADGTF